MKKIFGLNLLLTILFVITNYSNANAVVLEPSPQDVFINDTDFIFDKNSSSFIVDFNIINKGNSPIYNLDSSIIFISRDTWKEIYRYDINDLENINLKPGLTKYFIKKDIRVNKDVSNTDVYLKTTNKHNRINSAKKIYTIKKITTYDNKGNTSSDAISSLYNNIKSDGNSYILSFIFLIFTLILLVFIKNKFLKKHLLSISMIFFLSSITYIAVAVVLTNGDSHDTNIPPFYSKDYDKARFEVNIINDANNDRMELSIFDNKSDTVQNIPGATAKYAIDKDQPDTDIQFSDNNPTADVPIPSSITNGVHKFAFESPDLCGSAFGHSSYGGGSKFGKEKCEFSVNIYINNNGNGGQASDLNLIAYPQFVESGHKTKLFWDSKNINGNCTATSTTNSYWTGQKSNTNTSGYTTNQITNTEKFTLTCTDVNGRELEKTVTITPYTGGTQELAIQALPPVVAKGNTTHISWSSHGYQSCSVTENNDSITDDWSGENGYMQTSPINNQTVYTLQCTKSDSSTDTASVRVLNAVQWREN